MLILNKYTKHKKKELFTRSCKGTSKIIEMKTNEF